MDMCYITFRSVTLAQRGEAILKREGFKCFLQRTPRWLEKQGCGYGLRIRAAEVAACVEIFRENQVKFSKIYRLLEDGRGEELVL